MAQGRYYPVASLRSAIAARQALHCFERSHSRRAAKVAPVATRAVVSVWRGYTLANQGNAWRAASEAIHLATYF